MATKKKYGLKIHTHNKKGERISTPDGDIAKMPASKPHQKDFPNIKSVETVPTEQTHSNALRTLAQFERLNTDDTSNTTLNTKSGRRQMG